MSCASSGVPLTNGKNVIEEGADDNVGALLFSLPEMQDDTLRYIATPVYFSQENKSSEHTSLKDIQGVVIIKKLVSSSQLSNSFELGDIDMLSNVANHVGQVFYDKNQHMNIIEGVGHVGDINNCDDMFSLRLDSLASIPTHVARKVFLRINLWHGITPISNEYQSSSATVQTVKSNPGDKNQDSDADSDMEDALALKNSFETIGGGGVASFDGEVVTFGITVRNVPLAAKLIVTCHNAKNQHIIGHMIFPVFSEDKIFETYRPEKLVLVHSAPNENMREFHNVGDKNSGNMVLDFVSGCAGDMTYQRGRNMGPEDSERFKHIDTEQVGQSEERRTGGT